MRGFLLLSLALLEGARAGTCRIVDLPEMPVVRNGLDTVRFLDGTPVREGGWSALSRDPLDPTGHTYVAVNDRGLNVPLGDENDSKIFPAPFYHQKLATMRLSEGSLSLVRLDSLRLDGAPVLGLPSSLFPTGERAFATRTLSALPDTGHPLAALPQGLDLEGLRQGKTTGWLSEEYGPSILEFDRRDGRILRRWSPGQGLPQVYSTRRPNHGLEGLALTPSGHLVGLMESPLWNWTGKRKHTRDTRIVRMVRLDPRGGNVHEFVVLSDPAREGRHVKYGDLLALDEHRFLALEHGKRLDGSLSMDLWLIDIAQATDVTSPLPQGQLFRHGRKTLEELMDSTGLAAEGITPVRKTLVAADFGRTCGWSALKPEGIERLDDSTVAILNDNDYGLDRSGRFPEDGTARGDRSAAGRSSLLLLALPAWAR